MHIRPSVVAAVAMLLLMFVLAGGVALRESVTIDEVAHIGAGLSYVQKLDLRFNDEHPPLAKVLAGLPLTVRRADREWVRIAEEIEFVRNYLEIEQTRFGERLHVRSKWGPVLRTSESRQWSFKP